MKHTFTTPCFIRKNTPELRKKLEKLGYKLNNGKWMGKYLATFRIKETKEWRYVASPQYDLQNNPDIDISIDCGENEDLFLALAALRDDSDYMQWFCDDIKDCKSFFLCEYDNVEKHIHEKMDGWDCEGFHKATVDELIEHFKNK